MGAARIIDIADEKAPFVVSNLRLEVHQPENFAATADDPGTENPLQGYAGHYCNVPTRVDPTIVACSMIVLGTAGVQHRRPRPPGRDRLLQLAQPAVTARRPGNYAMSSPAFVPGAQRDLVLRRLHRLPRRAPHQRRVADAGANAAGAGAEQAPGTVRFAGRSVERRTAWPRPCPPRVASAAPVRLLRGGVSGGRAPLARRRSWPPVASGLGSRRSGVGIAARNGQAVSRRVRRRGASPPR